MNDSKGVIWTGFERAWRDALLAAMLPELPDSRRPGVADLDLSEFWAEFSERAPFLLRAGFRASVWLLTFMPIALFYSVRPFHRLTPERRDEFLKRSNNSSSYLIRQLVVSVKLVASLAYFMDAGVRKTFPGVPA